MHRSIPVALLATALITGSAAAASIDMNDPRRAVGREDDVRIDAQLLSENVSSGSPISITYQIQNLTAEPIAVAPRVASASYNADDQTITVGIGSEVPDGGVLPQLVTIAAGEKKTFTVAATARFVAAAFRGGFALGPRYVQVKVSVLRNIAPFRDLIDRQRPATAQKLSDQLFDRWLESNDTIFLNSIPVRYSPGKKPSVDAESAGFDAGT